MMKKKASSGAVSVFALAAVLSLLLAACGGGAEPTAAQPSPTATPTTVAATPTPLPPGVPVPTATRVAPTATPAPTVAAPAAWTPDKGLEAIPWVYNLPAQFENIKYGGTWHNADTSGSQFRTYDPVRSTTATPSGTAAKGGGYLVRWDNAPGVSNPFNYENYPVNDLAESYEVAEDGRVWTFKMRRDAFWQNRPPANGRRVTAQDALFSFERYAGPTSLQAPLFANLERFEAPDENTFRIIFKGPHPSNQAIIFFEYLPIHNPEYIKAKGGELGGIEADFVGIGPFQVKELVGGQKLVWEANPNYHLKDPKGNRLPYLALWEEITVRDTQGQLAAFRAGLIESLGLRPDLVESVYRTNSKAQFVRTVGASQGMTLLSFQLNNPLYQNVDIRRALSVAMDRKEINQTVYRNLADMSSTFSPGMLGLDRFVALERFGKYYQYNPTLAKELLAKAGYPNGIDLPGTAITYLGLVYNDVLVVVQQQWKKVGINLKINPLPIAQYSEQYFTGKFPDLAISALGNPGPDGQNWADAIKTGSATNPWHISDPDADALIEKARGTLDPKKRIDLFWQLFDLDADRVYRGWMYHGGGITVVQPWVRNFYRSGYVQNRTYGQVYMWLDK